MRHDVPHPLQHQPPRRRLRRVCACSAASAARAARRGLRAAAPRAAMAALSKLTILAFCLGWLLVAALVSVLGWTAYRREVRPWPPRDCDVASSKFSGCGDAGGYRIETKVVFPGRATAPVNTSDSRCIYETVYV